MATDATITLDTLHCIRQDDSWGLGDSEPYIWSFLLSVDDSFNLRTVHSGPARLVLQDDMKANQTVGIPSSAGRLTVRFDDILKVSNLILIVALLEADSTPNRAITLGNDAFNKALTDNLNLLNLALLKNAQDQHDQAAEDQLIKDIKTKVGQSVTAAIANEEGWRGALINNDDQIGSAFLNIGRDATFHQLLTRPVALSFDDNNGSAFTIQGRFELTPVTHPIDLCQAQVNAVQAAQGLVTGITNQIRSLQNELQHAGSGKPQIIAQIRQATHELGIADQKLDVAKAALATCRDHWQHHLPTTEPGGGVLVP